MEYGLTEKHAPVLASSRGLGLGAAETLAEDGASYVTGSMIRCDDGAIKSV